MRKIVQKNHFFALEVGKQLLDVFFLWKSIFQKNDVFYLWSINFSRKILQALEKIVFEKFNKFNISAFILCTFKCQKIFKIGSSNLKRSFRKSGSLFWKYGGGTTSFNFYLIFCKNDASPEKFHKITIPRAAPAAIFESQIKFCFINC